MADSDSVPLAQYHLARAYEAIYAYNRATQNLYRVWKGAATEYPFHEIETDWMDDIDAGGREVTASLLKDIAKDVNTRKKELDVSRQEDLHSWESSTVRDIEHSTIEDSLSRAASALGEVRDVL